MSKLKHIKFKEESEDIKPRVTNYWTDRADSFFIQRQHELNSPKAHKWLNEILKKIVPKNHLRFLMWMVGPDIS